MKTLQVSQGTHYVSDGLVIASGDAFIDCIDANSMATIILFENARCNAGGNSHVTARGDNLVNLFDDAEADVSGRTRLTAHEASTFTARKEAIVTALETSSGFVFDNASLSARGASDVTMMSRGNLVLADHACVLHAPFGSGRHHRHTVAALQALARTLNSCTDSNASRTAMNRLTTELGFGKVSEAQETLAIFAAKIRLEPRAVELLQASGFHLPA
ncbi:MAG: hypothetical protein KGS72_20330 [Cyanobacteria bacterium REEB67]|nr:hypothetical protein [Cyanobacteria bacterium REEB67]